jgi:hypothetical protein
MTDYDSAHTMDYNSWINRVASLRDIKPSQLEKEIEITPIKVTGAAFLAAKADARDEFNKLAEKYDEITDLKEGTVGTGIFGLLCSAYFINGTGIKFKNE